MSGIGNAIAKMPRSAQAGALGVVAVVLAIVAGMIGGWGTAVTVLVGAGIVGGAVYGYGEFLKRRDEKQASPFAGLLAGSAAGPTRIAEPARRARLDELRKSYETGLEKFRAAGKSLYSVPWYVLIGEPGSGKTEAVRHCGVGFPPGLQDELQGAGGTLNMSWWFTNQAVILDTAGRLLFEDVEPGSTSEWQEFLKLLKKSRPNCPVNGLLVVIPVDSLIKDSDEAIDAKAIRLAGQLDTIQKLLGVRFPAYVVITKSDLVNGFREFFDRTDDPRAANQILGWSNPDSLDVAFRPGVVEEHLKSVEQRLMRRRLGLLIDPVNTDDAKKARLEQVDALYAFPESLSRLGPRLRRYLDKMFVAGEWSARPLFLRGIYFTSALREGAALDADLAAALDVSPEKLPEGRIWERERALFLKDLFLNKVFKERGLVTRAEDTAGLMRARAATLLGVSAAGLGLIAVLTWLGAQGLQRAAVEPAKFWAAVAAAVESGKAPSVEQGRPPYRLPIVSKAIVTDEGFKYRGDEGPDASLLRDLPLEAGEKRIGALHGALNARAGERISVPVVFYPAAVIAGDASGSLLADEREAASRAAFEAGVLRPLMEGAAARLEADGAAERPWTPEATGALEQLIRTEAARVGGKVAGQGVQIEPLMRYALAGSEAYLLEGASDDVRDLQRVADVYYGIGGAMWPPESLAVDRSAVIASSVARFGATIDGAAQSAAGPAGRLIHELEQFAVSEERLIGLLGAQPPVAVDRWMAEIEPLRAAGEHAAALLPALSGRKLEQAAIQDAAGESSRLREDGQKLLDVLESAGEKSPALAQSGQALKASMRASSTRRVNLDELSARAAALAEAHLGRGLEPLFMARLGVYTSLAAIGESIEEPLPGLAIGEGYAHFEALTVQAEEARAAVRAAMPGGEGDARVKACVAAIESAAAARRAAIASAYAVTGAVDERALRAAAGRMASEAGDVGAVSTLPMARQDGRTAGLDGEFAPGTAPNVIAEVMMAAKAGAPTGTMARGGPGAAMAFLRGYVGAWTDGLAGAISPSDALGWERFVQGIESAGRAASVREGLATEAARQAAAADALKGALAGVQLSAEERQLVDRLVRIAAASTAAAANPAMDGAYDRVLANWRALGRDATEARRRVIGALGTPAGAQDYLVMSLADATETDLAARWWRGLSIAGLRTLTGEASRVGGASGGKFAKFPLAKFDAAAGQLTPAEVIEARAASASGAGGGSIADSIRDPDLAAEVRSLVQGGGSGGGLSAAMLTVLPERVDQRFACTAEILPDAGGGVAFGAVRIRQLGAETRTVPVKAGEATSLGRIDYPSASVQIEFLPGTAADAQPVATASIAGPWLGLWLIAAQNGRPVSAADRKVWEVGLPVETAAGPRTLKLHLRFEDRELPDPAQWPR